MRHSLRVLVVDDDAAIRSTVAELLRSYGLRVALARNGREALALCKDKCPFDAVLADVVMPEIGGVQLAELLRERYPTLPVILMTGRDSMVDTVIDVGAIAIVKPFTGEQLWRVIEERVKAHGR